MAYAIDTTTKQMRPLSDEINVASVSGTITVAANASGLMMLDLPNGFGDDKAVGVVGVNFVGEGTSVPASVNACITTKLVSGVPVDYVRVNVHYTGSVTRTFNIKVDLLFVRA